MSNSQRPITVCVFGYSEPEEGGRSWAIRTGLEENGITVKLCWTNVEGFFAKVRDLYRTWQGMKGEVDAIYVLFMGYYFMPLAWYLARRQGIPVILDALVSQYDTEVNDRKRVSRFHPRAWFLWIVDYISCFFADVIVVDTRGHKDFFVKKFYVDAKKFIVIPVGCRSDLFKPLPQRNDRKDTFVVEFHGSFIPLQGVEYIIDAAKILQDMNEPVFFEITGKGQMFTMIEQKVKELHLTNIEFSGGLKPIEELPVGIARADACLGIFGTTEKAVRVVPNKVYECLNCGKPVITERSPAALDILHDHEDVLLVEPGNGADIAAKILELKRDAALRTSLGERARAISLSTFSPRTIVVPLVNWLQLHA